MESRTKILIVDNDFDYNINIKNTLEINNYNVLIVNNRTQAQRTIRNEKPSLIVLGTIAPRGSAFLLHQWIKRSPSFCNLPIIVIDASPDKQLTQGWSKNEGPRLEAEDYFCKPIEPKALVHAIEKYLDKATARIRVLVVDDHPVVRDAIRVLLNLQNDIEVVGEAIDGRDAINKTRKLSPDVILMDIVMPGMNGLDATRAIRKDYKDAKVLMLTQYDDSENIVASIKAGALDCISKKSAGSQLIDGIRSVKKRNR
jgi:DNA-binding NarL/FixJ family response regulator